MASPTSKKGPRVPLPSRTSRPEREDQAPLLSAAAAPPAPAPAPASMRSHVSSAAVSVSSSAVSVPQPARSNLAPALTPVPAYTYQVPQPVTYVAPPVTVQAPPVTVAAPIVTSPVTVTSTPVMPAAAVQSRPLAQAMSLFDALDANGDGVLDASEFAQLRTMDGRRAQPPMPPMEPVTV